MTRPLIIHHAGCVDGFTAAWIAHRHFKGECDLQPAHYGDALPDATSREGYVLDFSYPIEVLRELAAQAGSIVLIDHHKSALQGLASLWGHEDDAEDWAERTTSASYYGSEDGLIPNLRVHYNRDMSGAQLTWEHFHGYAAPPRLVRYVEDRDLWRWDLASSRQVSAWIGAQPFSIASWDALERDTEPPDRFARVVAHGDAILLHTARVVASHVERAEREHDAELGFAFPVVNATTAISEIGNELAKLAPFAATYQLRDGLYVYSLRSSCERGDAVDVSKIAECWGGGGHKHAAGFRATEPVHRPRGRWFE